MFAVFHYKVSITFLPVAESLLLKLIHTVTRTSWGEAYQIAQKSSFAKLQRQI